MWKTLYFSLFITFCSIILFYTLYICLQVPHSLSLSLHPYLAFFLPLKFSFTIVYQLKFSTLDFQENLVRFSLTFAHLHVPSECVCVCVSSWVYWTSGNCLTFMSCHCVTCPPLAVGQVLWLQLEPHPHPRRAADTFAVAAMINISRRRCHNISQAAQQINCSLNSPSPVPFFPSLACSADRRTSWLAAANLSETFSPARKTKDKKGAGKGARGRWRRL